MFYDSVLWRGSGIYDESSLSQLSDEESGGEEGGGGRGSVKPILSLPSLSLLQSWYTNTHQQVGDTVLPSHPTSPVILQSQECPPVVIIVEDFEGFPTHILQDLIMSIR